MRLQNRFKLPSNILYYCPFQGVFHDLVLCVVLVLVSVLLSLSVCLDDI